MATKSARIPTTVPMISDLPNSDLLELESEFELAFSGVFDVLVVSTLVRSVGAVVLSEVLEAGGLEVLVRAVWPPLLLVALVLGLTVEVVRVEEARVVPPGS
jgi:hypothetical protein